MVPDRDGEVYDKIYEYNEQDESEIKELIKIVYALITSLGFMDDPEIFVPSDNTLGLKDIKKFIALLLAKTSKK